MSERCYGCMKIKQDHGPCEHCGWQAEKQNEPHQLPQGTVLQNQYLVGKVLGQGGFGITYIGWDMALEKIMAIKEYYPNSAVTRNTGSTLALHCPGEQAQALFAHNRDRFLKEARTLARLKELPGIVRVQRLFEENNTAYMVMEYLQGMTLTSFATLQEKPLQPREALAILEPVMFSLSRVHNAGLIHRDISPDNIMLLGTGNVKLLDFGAVKEIQDPEQGKAIQQSTEAILKHGFAPPEQYQRVGMLGPWSDVYALCATLYFCMTGKIPSSAPERIMGEDNIRWDRIPGLSENQRNTLEKGMALLPENRIPSMEALWKGLREENPREEAKTTEPQPESKPAAGGKGKKLGILAAGAAAILGIALLLPRREAALRQTANTPAATVTQAVQTDSAAETPETPETTVPAPTEPAWQENRLMTDPLGALEGVARNQITRISFLGTTAEASADAWDVSMDQDRSVLAWVSRENGDVHVHIAAEGGINVGIASRKLFRGCKNLRQIDFGGSFHTEQSTDMSEMFRQCTALEAVDLQGLDTSRVTDMSAMFDSCAGLTQLDLEGLKTGLVTDMSRMFSHCTGLRKINVRGWDTASVENMNSMFSHCSSLEALDLQDFRTPRVRDLGSLCGDCAGLRSVNVSGFDTAAVTDMSGMFYGCAGLEELNLDSFRTPNVENMTEMFLGCEQLRKLDLSKFDFSNVIGMAGVFSGCLSLEELDLGEFNLNSYANIDDLYLNCYKLSTEEKRIY